MSTTARDLVDKLIAAGTWPEPKLLEDILAQGETAIEPLVEYVRREEHDWSEDYIHDPLDFVVNLLSSLHATSALPALLNLYRVYEEDILDIWVTPLEAFGPEIIEPALGVVRDRSLNWYQRAMASEVAQRGAKNDPASRAYLALQLRDILTDYIAHADELTDEDHTAVGSLIIDLTILAHPETRATIEQAYALDIVDESMIEREDIEAEFNQGGTPFTPRSKDWLADYKKEYADHTAQVRRQKGIDRYTELFEPPKLRPVRNLAKLSRNDPCWCGSGKKYKNCHMREDEAQERGKAT